MTIRSKLIFSVRDECLLLSGDGSRETLMKCYKGFFRLRL